MDKLSSIIAMISAILIAAAPASAAGTSGFCASLKFAAAQTRTNFKALQGAELSARHGTSGLTYTDYTYAATSSLAGAIPSSCQVVNTIDEGKLRSSAYRCFFDYGGPKRLAKLRSLADAIGACIGYATNDSDFNTDEDVGYVDFVQPKFEVDIDASDSQPLVLVISKPDKF
jgi:hypothetical protein